jgi:hypothetical protein
MGPISCPETSIRNYHSSLRNNGEERSSHLLRGRSLKSRIVISCFLLSWLFPVLLKHTFALILSSQLNVGLHYFAFESPCKLCSCLLNVASVVIRVTYEARSTCIGVIPNSNLCVLIVVIVFANYGG